MRGIEFLAHVGYGDVLNTLLSDIHLCDYDFYISQDDILSDLELPEIPMKANEELFYSLNKCSSYYVFFINLHAYKKGAEQKNITTYDEFLQSDCEFIFLINDGEHFEIYVKDEQLLLQFIRNAIKLNGEDIIIKTDYNDGRKCMSVW